MITFILMKSLKLNTSYKHHSIVGLIIGVWLALFLVLIAPFDASDLPFLIRLEILPFYGVISFLSYIIIIPLQNWVFKKLQKWTLLTEITFIIVLNLVVLIGSYFYYKTEIINGTYSFITFTLEVYYPIFFILLIVLIFARWYLNKKTPSPKNEKIILKGDNKLDVLQIEISDLVSISSADNYIEVNYLKNGSLQKKLLRTTLKNVHADLPSLLKVHRSYLINPTHFKEWKNSNTLYLTQMEVPVSKNYKKEVLVMNHSSLKTTDSPQY